jgi:hypothetical protein
MNVVNIAIIGLGPRGLSVLERCLKFASLVEYQLNISIIEESELLGIGIHSPIQPDYLLLNTVCSQLSMFPGKIGNDRQIYRDGLNFFSWAKEKGYKLHHDGYTVRKYEGREIQENDHLPRRLLGEYLHWFYIEITSDIPNNVTIQHYHHTAIDIISEGKSEIVILNNDYKLKADFVFITIGHTTLQKSNNHTPKTLSPYPIPDNLNAINSNQTVAIAGFGLTSIDVITALTVGRGGKHEQGKYIPSGLEPSLIMYSRCGLPFRARPLFNRKLGFDAVIFSKDTINNIKQNKDGLDYETDLKPLLELEVTCRFYLQHEYLRNGYKQANLLYQRLCNVYQERKIYQELACLEDAYGYFDFNSVVYPHLEDFCQNSNTYQARVLDLIKEDLVESYMGIHDSPLKSALEAYRDFRDTLRHAFNWGGLYDSSHALFMRNEVGLINRLVIGPQKERHQEILALVEAGILKIPLGPSPKRSFNGCCWELSSTKLANFTTITADWIIEGFSHSPTLKKNNSRLLENLCKSGRFSSFKNHCPSVKITQDYQPIDTNENVQKHLWVLGPLLEGTTFYNHYVPSPDPFCLAFIEAHSCVKELFDIMSNSS